MYIPYKFYGVISYFYYQLRFWSIYFLLENNLAISDQLLRGNCKAKGGIFDCDSTAQTMIASATWRFH